MVKQHAVAPPVTNGIPIKALASRFRKVMTKSAKINLAQTVSGRDSLLLVAIQHAAANWGMNGMEQVMLVPLAAHLIKPAKINSELVVILLSRT